MGDFGAVLGFGVGLAFGAVLVDFFLMGAFLGFGAGLDLAAAARFGRAMSKNLNFYGKERTLSKWKQKHFHTLYFLNAI